MPNFPSRADWLFSLRSFAAAALAMYLAFLFDLPKPYWALGTVYIVAQPFAGAVRAKAKWRFAGTLGGGIFAVVALPNLVNAPVLFCAAMALWIGLCLAASLYDTTPRGYGFVLSGYTAALIAFPIVDDPGSVFLTAVDRCEEIGLGIGCAWLMHGVLFPRRGTPMLLGAAGRWLRDLARFGADSLTGPHDPNRFSAERRRIARDGAALNALFQQARYEAAGRRAQLLWVPRLHEHGRALPTLLTAIGERSRNLAATDPEAASALRPALEAIAAWMAESAADPMPDPAPRARALAAQLEAVARELAAARPAPEPWAALLRDGLMERLRELLTQWQECLGLIARILSAEPSEAAPEGPRAPAGHVDPLLVALSGFAAMVAIGLGCAIWIGTGWAHGTSLGMMAAVVLCIFAQLDDPAPVLKQFTLGSVLAVVFAGLYLFVVLPRIDGFVLLLLVLAPLYLPIGALIPQQRVMAVALAVAVTLPAVINLQETYSADFPGFADGGIATILALVLALTITRLARSVGVAWRLQRLSAADRRDLARLAEGRSAADLRIISGAMLDRFEALAARLAAPDAPIRMSELADLRASVNLLRLRDRMPELSPPSRDSVQATLAALSANARGHGSAEALLSRLDQALATTMAEAGRAAHLAALSLSGLRLALFPEAPPPVLAPAAAP
jgi:uncharacterized membrane protein YccC